MRLRVRQNHIKGDETSSRAVVHTWLDVSFGQFKG